MKYFFNTLLIVLAINAGAQHLNHIKYVRTYNIQGNSTQFGFSLTSNPEKGLSSFLTEGSLTESDTIVTTPNELTTRTFIVQKSNNAKKGEIQKDFVNNTLKSLETIFGEKEMSLITEELPVMDWEILNENKEILGYNVQKAITNFRGRKYEAWFAPKIQIPDGPWKFSGLPGLILEVKSTDGFVKFLAYELNLNLKQDISIIDLKSKNPNLIQLSREDRKKIEMKNIEKQVKYLQSQNPSDTEVKIDTHSLEIEE